MEPDKQVDKIARFQSRIIELDIRKHHKRGEMETVNSHNAPLTGSTEDLVSENDYRRKIAELELTIAALNGRAWRADEKLIEMGKANLNLYRQVQGANRLISILNTRIENYEKWMKGEGFQEAIHRGEG